MSESNRKDRQLLQVGLLVDESGSMRPLQPTVITGINEFLADLREYPAEGWEDGVDVRASLAMFDQRGGAKPVRVRFAGIPLAEVSPLGPGDYQPHGATPLNDAVLQTIGAIDGKARKRDRVMIVILTDGLENASEASTADVRRAIQKKEERGWEFIYLGANQDSWAESGKIGLAQPGKYFGWDASEAGLGAAMKVTGERAMRFRDAPDEYRAEQIHLASEIAPGETKARRLSDAERRSRGRRGGRGG